MIFGVPEGLQILERIGIPLAIVTGPVLTKHARKDSWLNVHSCGERLGTIRRDIRCGRGIPLSIAAKPKKETHRTKVAEIHCMYITSEITLREYAWKFLRT